MQKNGSRLASHFFINYKSLRPAFVPEKRDFGG